MLAVLVCVLFTITSVQCSVHGAGSDLIGDSPQARTVFMMADKDNNTLLTFDEFHVVFLDFDENGDGNVTSTEFVTGWIARALGDTTQAVSLFLNLDVNKDLVIDEPTDVPYIFVFFDRNRDQLISEGEFVIQWVKISM